MKLQHPLRIFVLVAVFGALALAASVHALPTYDAFSTYGASGALLGGNTAPSGESWIAYTNETLANLVAGANVCITNYFTTHADTLSAPLPANFPGPFVSENDTSTNSVWTPGYLGANTRLGGVGASLACFCGASSSLGSARRLKEGGGVGTSRFASAFGGVGCVSTCSETFSARWAGFTVAAVFSPFMI